MYTIINSVVKRTEMKCVQLIYSVALPENCTMIVPATPRVSPHADTRNHDIVYAYYNIDTHNINIL